MIIRYVSPTGNNANSGLTSGQAWATVAFAKTAVRDLIAANPGESITVFLTDGRHAITSTLEFTEDDSAAAGYRVTWKAASGASPVISGGVVVSTWTSHNSTKKIWVADFTGTECRQLYINGIRCKRARRVGDFTGTATDTGFTTTDAVTDYGNITDVEFIFRKDFREARVQVASAVSGTSVTMKEPVQSYYVEMGNLNAARAPIAIENAYEILEEGKTATFYWDRADEKIYLIPPASIANPNTATVIVPQVQKLATFDGASRIDFSGISWEHGQWLHEGYVEIQTSVMMINDFTQFQKIDVFGELSPACVELYRSSDISFSDGKFVRLGTHAIAVLEGCDKITIQRNLIADNSGSGVIIGQPKNIINGDAPRRVVVDNNLITYCGQEDKGSAGITPIYFIDVQITNNDISYMPYSGISAGWGWGNNLWHNTHCNSGTIKGNTVNQVMLELNDGAGIYIVGMFKDIKVEENFVRNVLVGGNAFYPDIGTTNLTLRNNVFGSFLANWINYHLCFGNFTVTGNWAATFNHGYESPTTLGNYSAAYPDNLVPDGYTDWTYANPSLYDFTNPAEIPAGIVAAAGRADKTTLVAPAIGEQVSVATVCNTDFTTANWFANNLTVTAGLASRDGGTKGHRLTNNTTNGEHRIYYITGTTAHARGVWVKVDTVAPLHFLGLSHDGSNGSTIDARDGTVTNYGSGVTGTATFYGDGWWFFSIALGGANDYLIINIGETENQARAGTSYVGTTKGIIVAGAIHNNVCITN